MPLDLGVLEYVREQLSLVEPVVVKRMFGGAGFYARGYFFALLDDDTLYFKTDDSNRGDYLAIGSPQFSPFGDDRLSMNYHELPEKILDNATKLKSWMEKSIDVAISAKGRKGAGKRSASKAVKTGTKRALSVKPGKVKKTRKAGVVKKAANKKAKKKGGVKKGAIQKSAKKKAKRDFRK